MLEYDFEQSVGFWVAMTARCFEQALNEQLAPHGITYRQWQVLAWLALEGELSQVMLAERMRLEPPTLVGILDRMEKAGWIKRQSCPADRRRKLIVPTAAAVPIWEKVAACARAIRAQATLDITDEQVQTLRCTLERIQNNLDRTRAAQRVNGAAPHV